MQLRPLMLAAVVCLATTSVASAQCGGGGCGGCGRAHAVWGNYGSCGSCCDPCGCDPCCDPCCGNRYGLLRGVGRVVVGAVRVVGNLIPRPCVCCTCSPCCEPCCDSCCEPACDSCAPSCGCEVGAVETTIGSRTRAPRMLASRSTAPVVSESMFASEQPRRISRKSIVTRTTAIPPRMEMAEEEIAETKPVAVKPSKPKTKARTASAPASLPRHVSAKPIVDEKVSLATAEVEPSTVETKETPALQAPVRIKKKSTTLPTNPLRAGR